ncbi:hypothetical protein ACJW31_11G061200 [Castanea mollissima]
MEEDNSSKIYHLFVKLLDGKTLTLRLPSPTVPALGIKHRVHEITKIPLGQQRLVTTGLCSVSDETLIRCPEGTSLFPSVQLSGRLAGGKGGFGSLLRGAATKAGQKKTNNFDACRDMSGRRLRHVNAEKRLEEWKAEEEERKLEKIAEDFIKKKAKKGKKGVGDGLAHKYVAKYREESERCVAEVLDSVNDALALKKRKAGPAATSEAKRANIWMGKRKLGESDSDDTDEDEDEEERKEKSVVLNGENHSDLSKEEVEGSSGSVTGEKQVACESESGSEGEKDTVLQEIVESNGCAEVVEPVICDKEMSETTSVSFSDSTPEAVAVDETANVLNFGNREACDESLSVDSQTNGNLDSKSSVHEETVVTTNAAELEKPLNFDEFNSAAEMEVLGMERLKSELQARGLKCGGTLQERAARLFLLKSTPLDKLPKKLLAKK